METIIITNTIEQNKILIAFDFQQGELSFPSVEINTEGDVDFNFLVIKLSEILEFNRELEVEFNDSNNLVVENSKIGLIKSTLEEIYEKFNDSIKIENIDSSEIVGSL